MLTSTAQWYPKFPLVVQYCHMITIAVQRYHMFTLFVQDCPMYTISAQRCLLNEELATSFCREFKNYQAHIIIVPFLGILLIINDLLFSNTFHSNRYISH